MRFRALILVGILAAIAATVSAQLPRPRTVPRTQTALRQYLATATIGHTVTVAKSGGDYTTLTAALAYVATQTRSDVDPWLVLIYPGLYDAEGAISVPTYTHVQGVGDGYVNFQPTLTWSNAGLYDTTPNSGPVFVTLAAGSSIDNITIYGGDGDTLTGPYTVLKTTGLASASNISVWVDVAVNGQTVYGIESNGLMGRGVTVTGYATGSTYKQVRAVTSSTQLTGSHLTSVSGTPGARLSVASGAIGRLHYTRIDAGATVDLENAGTLSVRASPYFTASGAITSQDSIGTNCQVLSGSAAPESAVSAPVCSVYYETTSGMLYQKATGSGDTGWKSLARASAGTTAPAACAVGEIFTDTDTGPSVCVCTATDTWKCAVVS